MTKADWLRSEIEKLEGVEGKEYDYSSIDAFNEVRTEAWDEALTSIITRYKEELLELDRREV